MSMGNNWNAPRTAHGKLKAVITPTIPSGFHTCIKIKHDIVKPSIFDVSYIQNKTNEVMEVILKMLVVQF